MFKVQLDLSSMITGVAPGNHSVPMGAIADFVAIVPANVVVLMDNIGAELSVRTVLGHPQVGTVVGDTALVLDPSVPVFFVLGFDMELKLAEIPLIVVWDHRCFRFLVYVPFSPIFMRLARSFFS